MNIFNDQKECLEAMEKHLGIKAATEIKPDFYSDLLNLKVSDLTALKEYLKDKANKAKPN